MATANSLGMNQSITLERDQVITISKRTVRFWKNVYQTHNIAGFSEGQVGRGSIPFKIIIIVFIVGLIVTPFIDAAILLSLAAIVGIVWNFFNRKYYGLLLTLNSGDKKLFVTTDKEGLRQVIQTIYDFIEEQQDTTYQITVNNSKIKGNFIQGHADTVTYK
ncbi:MAG: hypothetical protein F6K41_13225 [Symploca sp. SIO3E6]|nr:hypothetical protein [Caldora sp. SIO3E6]